MMALSNFASRVLSPSEQKYSQIDKEALAIIYGVEKFHEYLYCQKFTIFSDHKPLMYIFSEDKTFQEWCHPTFRDG